MTSAEWSQLARVHLLQNPGSSWHNVCLVIPGILVDGPVWGLAAARDLWDMSVFVWFLSVFLLKIVFSFCWPHLGHVCGASGVCVPGSL